MVCTPANCQIVRGKGHLCQCAFGLRDLQQCNDVRSAGNCSVIAVCPVMVFVAVEYAGRTVACVCRGPRFDFSASSPFEEMYCPRACDVSFLSIRPQLPMHCAVE